MKVFLVFMSESLTQIARSERLFVRYNAFFISAIMKVPMLKRVWRFFWVQ